MSITTTRELILVLGGARAGKSTFAEQLAAAGGQPVTFIATAEPLDDEMRARIARHRATRSADWTTIEAPIDLAGALRAVDANTHTVLIDCMTLWVGNLLLHHKSMAGGESFVQRHIDELIPIIAGGGVARSIIVSNEVGLGLVPANEIGRLYRDALGRVNQTIAAAADRVYFLVAGLPMLIKGAP